MTEERKKEFRIHFKKCYDDEFNVYAISPEDLFSYLDNISIPMQLPVKPAKADKEIEELKRALRVIYTWATFEGGIALVPDHVERLIKKINIQP